VRVLWRLTNRSFIDGWPVTTPGNVKLLLPPRQSRGNSHWISRSVLQINEAVSCLSYFKCGHGTALAQVISFDGPGTAILQSLRPDVGETSVAITTDILQSPVSRELMSFIASIAFALTDEGGTRVQTLPLELKGGTP